MEKASEPPRKPQGLPLGAFLEENQRLITLLGVFSALTLFAGTVRPVEFGRFLSSIFLTLVVLIWLELWSRFPSKAGGWRLSLFESILSLAVLAMVGYWIVVVHVWFRSLITLLVWGGAMAAISKVIKRYDLFNRVFRTVPQGRPKLRYAVGLLVQLVVLGVSLGIASLIGPPLDRAVDNLSAEWIQAPSR